MTDTNTVLLGIIAIGALITPLMLIGVGIVISAHLSELRTSVVGLHIWLMNENAADDDDSDDFDDSDPPPTTPAVVAFGQELERELQGRGIL